MTGAPSSLRPALWLIAAVTLARLAFLAFSPYELAADEAQYWDWSRNLAPSYHTKGPGAAWTIAASVALFGTSAFTVRLPAVLASALMALALALHARGTAPRGEGSRAALMAVVTALCIPAYHAAALLMTIDGPMLACWAFAGLAAWRLDGCCRGAAPARARFAYAALLGLALGLGFLFKYTILLAGVGAVLALLVTRRDRTRPVVPALAVSAAVFLVCITPVLVWNAQRGWPTVAHLLGHLGLQGSDLPGAAPRAARPYTPLWTLEYLGVLVALAGPVIVCMALAVRHALRQGDAARRAAVFALCGSLPVLFTYLAVSFFTDVEGNWAIGAWIALIPVTGVVAAEKMREHADRVRAWLALPVRQRPRAGVLRRRPESIFQIAWHWSIGFGAVAAVGMLCLEPLSRAPLIGPLIPIQRISGSKELAAEVDAQRRRLATDTGKEPILIGARYTHTALLAFYCEGRPAVCCAASRLGDRRSPYDDFPSTDLTSPALLGRPAVLVDTSDTPRPERWLRALRFDRPPEAAARIGRHVIYSALGYAGVVESEH